MGLRSRWAAGAWVRIHRLHGQEQGTALQLSGGGPGPLRAMSAKGTVCAGQAPAAAGSGRRSLLSPCGKQDSPGGIVQVGWRKNSAKAEQTDSLAPLCLFLSRC